MSRHHTSATAWSPARRFVAGAAAVPASIVWTHGLAAVLRHVGPDDAPLAAAALTVAAAVAGVVGAALLPRDRAEALAAVVGTIGALAIELNSPGSGAGALALLPVAVAATGLARWIGGRLPGSVDTATRFRPVVAAAWALVVVVAVVQVGRLATSMTDRRHGFVLTTEHPFWYMHECFGAYLYGAELAMRGEPNIYDTGHYRGLDRDAEPDSRLEGVTLDDPYQYPPQFLLLPRLALALTDDVATIRVVWFALQATLFAAVAVLLARWIGGPAGRLSVWLLPLVTASFPFLHNLQFGQFHLAAIVLAVAAMLLFERGRPAVGGALLAAAILAKVFPAVLLPLLLARGRLRALAWTAAFGLAITLAALAVVGPAPFEAFLAYQLPRLGDGSAFAFDEAWPELADLVIADNQGVFGLARKLGAAKPLAASVARIFGLGVVGVAALVGLRRRNGSRLAVGAGWLALLGLGSLSSPGAWGDYVPVTAVWLLSLLALPMMRSRSAAAVLGTAWLFQLFLVGTMPIGDWTPVRLMVPVSAIGATVLLALFLTTLALPASACGTAAASASSMADDREPERLRRAA